MRLISFKDAAAKVNFPAERVRVHDILLVFGDAHTPQSMWTYKVVTQEEYNERRKKGLLRVPEYRVIP
jgi:hypothetical protein